MSPKYAERLRVGRKAVADAMAERIRTGCTVSCAAKHVDEDRVAAHEAAYPGFGPYVSEDTSWYSRRYREFYS